MSFKSRSTLPNRTVVTDICLATAWAAAIPALMWLGAAGGF